MFLEKNINPFTIYSIQKIILSSNNKIIDSQNMTKILLLGGAGFIGSNIANFLVRHQKNIIIIDKNVKNNHNLVSIKNKAKIIESDLNNIIILAKIFSTEKIDIVIHLASNIIPSSSFDKKEIEKEVDNVKRLINIMHKNGANKLIFFSSGGTVYGANKQDINYEDSSTNPINFYGQAKLAIEKYILEANNHNKIKYIILRPSNAYGRNQNIYGKQGLIAATMGKILLKQRVEVWGNGNIIRDYIYIDDLCRALYLLIKNNKWNNIYNIGTGKGASVNQILKIIKTITKTNFKVNYTHERTCDIPVNILNTVKIKNQIDWGELTSLEEGIRLTWEEIMTKKRYES